MKNLFWLFIVFLSFQANAQITTSGISGVIKDDNNSTLPGATITVIHIPTATQFHATSDLNGHFHIDQLKAGGPYSLSISFIGFTNYKKDNLYLELGIPLNIQVRLAPSTVTLQAAEVVYDKADKFNNEQPGVATHLNEKRIMELPTINRSLQDVTKLSPQGNSSSFAGTNYRFNNLSIDGASNNDVLGFQEPASGAGGTVASGTPGALARTQPISLDAIQEVTVSIAPYDVQQGNFTGASINAVTRSGTNSTTGSVYIFGRNQILTGKSIDNSRTPIEDFHDYQGGFRLGGPIVKNKLFYFVNYERGRIKEPVLSEAGSENSNIPLDVAKAISDTLIQKYNYDPGSPGSISNETKSDKFFIRFDYNLGKRHQLTLRNNLVIASSDNLERNISNFKFASQKFTHNSITNSLVTELKSRFTNNFSNHLILGYNRIEDDRDFDGAIFPHIQITYNTANTIYIGPYREASIYGLTLNTVQLTDKVTLYKNKHTINLGTHNEIYNIQYRFLTAWNGRWEYRTLDDFFSDRPRRIRGVYNLENNNYNFNRSNPSADFDVYLLSAYLQDKYTVNDKLTITAGLRIDHHAASSFPNNPDVQAIESFQQYNNEINSIPDINPRASFQYALNDKIHVRGGTGLFTGRIPFAWYAYAHYISGLNYGNIDLRPNDELALTDDLSELRSEQPNLREINLIDNDFNLPREWRSSIGIDFKLEKDWVVTVEGMYSKTLQGIQFKSINLTEPVGNFEGTDNRPYYAASSTERKVNPNFTNVFLLSNTNKGFQYNLSVSSSKKFTQNLSANAAYTYGKSMDVSNGVRNSMAANFNWNQAVASNNPDLAYSNFDIRHRAILGMTYNHKFSQTNHSLLSIFFSTQSGSPYSYTYEGDINRDGSSKNDLLFIPSSKGDIVLTDITDGNGNVVSSADNQWIQLDNYIENDPYLSENRGKYAERNGARTPWNYRMDVRLAHRLYLSPEKNTKHFEFTLDIINFPNLINRHWGHQYFVPNNTNSSYQLIELDKIENNQPVYQFKNPDGKPWQTDQLNSRWQAQIGIRYTF